MSFQHIIGQDRAKQILQNGLRRDKLSHAYLFNGPTGTGKKNMAISLAKAIFCNELVDDACGQCAECRKVDHHNHPNLYEIIPDGTTIKIEQIRELQKNFSYRSGANETKIYIIEEAEKMSIQAGNSLLKFLEEPVSKVMAILITDNAKALLPTIQSRTEWISFTPMPPKGMMKILLNEGHSHLLVAPAVHITSGLEAAREVISIKWFAEMRNVVIQLAQECFVNLASASILAQNKVIKTELADHMDTLLDLFVLWFKDMIHIHCGRKDQVIFIDQLDWLLKHAYQNDVNHWVECMERALDSRKRLRAYANPQLTLEHFMSQL